MLRLTSSPLAPATAAHLAQCQTAVDTHADPAAHAVTLWDAKKRSVAGAAAFADIKQQLLGMCVGTQQCPYCEHNEAGKETGDIEHIYPKSFYPERAFQWDNYLLACKACNWQKSDLFAVFPTPGSAAWVSPVRKDPTPKGDAAFIDPRTDDPFALLWADIRRDGVYLIPHPDLQPGTREWVKADRTLTILKIDQRVTLVKARLRALSDYQARLRAYREVAAATTFEQLQKAVNDPQSRYIDTKQPFAQEQATMLAGLKASIQESDHPTVWREMKRQYLSLPTTKQLFESLPPGVDAMNW